MKSKIITIMLFTTLMLTSGGLAQALSSPVKQYEYLAVVAPGARVKFKVDFEKGTIEGRYHNFTSRGTISECSMGIMCMKLPGFFDIHIPIDMKVFEQVTWSVEKYSYRIEAKYEVEDGMQEFLIRQSSNNGKPMIFTYSRQRGVRTIVQDDSASCTSSSVAYSNIDCVLVLVSQGLGLNVEP